MHHANCNVKTVRKVLVKYFDSNHSIVLSYDNKHIAKIGAPGYSLVLCPKTKGRRVAEVVEVIAAGQDTVVNSNLVPTVIFDIDVPKTTNLGNFYNG